MQYILAIDQGTTSTRAIAFDKKGNIIAVSQQDITQYFPKPGWVEHNPVEILESVLFTVREVAEKIGSSEVATRILIHRLRVKFRTLLREEVAHTVLTPGEIPGELAWLQSVLAK